MTSRRDWVIIDTCIWATFFSRSSSQEKINVDFLIDTDRVALIGPILTEVLRGFRRDEEASWTASRLRAAHWLETDWEDWEEAARLGRKAASEGHSVPVADLVVAATA
ncbi:MAG: PIN domain-containing protein, partial [Verrucomicrobiota bacterium]